MLLCRRGFMANEKYNENLIQAKIRQAQTKKVSAASRSAKISAPGQTVTSGWPILDLGVRPKFDQSTWTLAVDGEVENPIIFSWAEFLKLPQTAITADFHCVTRWSRLNNHWEGVTFKALFERVSPKPEAGFVIFGASDGYTTNVPMEDLLPDNCLLASKHDGEALPEEHGGPLRVIIPHLYGWKGAKWVNKITFSKNDAPGFWEVRGYHNHGIVEEEERYS